MSKRYGLFAVIVWVVCAGAQEIPKANVKGRLHSETERILRGYVIELEQLGSHGNVTSADVEADGDFSFRGIPAGNYLLRVTTYQGRAISQQFVTIQDYTASLDVRLPSQGASPTGETVSFTELRHPPARKAVDATLAAQRFAASGHYDRAAGELEKAVRISPEFAAAHSNLGVQYLRMRRFEEARLEIERAISIAGPNARDLVNLAFAMTGLERLPDAMEAARGALRIEHDLAAAHYVLGLLLTIDGGTRGEGIAHLETAAKTMESAKNALQRFVAH